MKLAAHLLSTLSYSERCNCKSGRSSFKSSLRAQIFNFVSFLAPPFLYRPMGGS